MVQFVWIEDWVGVVGMYGYGVAVVGSLVDWVVCGCPDEVVVMMIDRVGCLHVGVVGVACVVGMEGEWDGVVGSGSAWDGSSYALGGRLIVGSIVGCWSNCLVCMRCSYVVLMFDIGTVVVVCHIWLGECPLVVCC